MNNFNTKETNVCLLAHVSIYLSKYIAHIATYVDNITYNKILSFYIYVFRLDYVPNIHMYLYI